MGFKCGGFTEIEFENNDVKTGKAKFYLLENLIGYNFFPSIHGLMIALMKFSFNVMENKILRPINKLGFL